MRVAILGFGIEGRSAASYYAGHGADITVHDRDPELVLPDGLTGRLGEHYLEDLDGYDLVVRSQSIHPGRFSTKAQVTSVIQEFMERCPAPIIGITGTKGKGTTSSLIAAIVAAAGYKVWLAGNIGRAPLDFVDEVSPSDVVVLELSSGQLIDVTRSPQVAVCLMISPDHLNWHADMAEYTAAKANLFRYQSTADLAVHKAGDPLSEQIAAVSPGRHLAYGEAPAARVKDGIIVVEDTPICAVSAVGLVGPHNLENICAAITATWELVVKQAAPVRDAVIAFTGLEHRLELVAEDAGVKYYDDSFATTPETAIAAIRSFEAPKVMILGGSDKGASYDELAEVVAREGVIHAFLIGDTAPQLEAALTSAGFDHFTTGYTNMAKLVSDCAAVTEPGDVVLLSPGCASFGLFTDYKDRGNQFKAAVRRLVGEK
jgi:UDP-N-acetylmuramoylalanine--D-glutamate ligase